MKKSKIRIFYFRSQYDLSDKYHPYCSTLEWRTKRLTNVKILNI